MVIGSGGREHAIAWKLSQSSMVEKIYCAPGNGGTYYTAKCENVDISEIDEMAAFAQESCIDITVVGPEAPLVRGITDEFNKRGLKIFGPSKAAAQLEGSKAFAKEFMKKYKVKTAAYEVFEERRSALNYLEACSYPIVIKADGLAAGKGVAICKCFAEAEEVVNSFMIKDIFKGAGKRLVIEEYLEGFETSILAVTDGNTILPMLSAKDHKTIFENNQGPNTGGMGAVAPNPDFTEEAFEAFKQDIMLPTLKGIVEESMHYVGIIFFGLMINEKGVFLLEYNVRMGDPETQAILPLMESDFAEVIVKAVDRKLQDQQLIWKEGYSCSVVAASKDYPGEFETGYEIKGIDKVKGNLFIAGGSRKNESVDTSTLSCEQCEKAAASVVDKLVTSGGRVLSVCCQGNTLEEARQRAYDEMKVIDFEGIFYRNDIGDW